MLLTSCSADRNHETQFGRQSWTQPHVLRIAANADPDSLNEYVSGMDVVDQIGSLIFSALVTADPQGRLVGDLATVVPSRQNGGISPDGKTYRYHLRRGVLWQDGVPLTSRDVKFSWSVVMNPNNPIEHREGYDAVSTIETPDDDTVVVHLKHRDPPFVTQFFTSIQEGPKGILPSHLLAKYPNIMRVPYNGSPIGSGPFRVTRWVRGEKVILTRNDRYFRGAPKLEQIEFDIYPDSSTVLNQMRVHGADLVVDADLGEYEQYATLKNVRVDSAPSNVLILLAMNDKRPGLKDVSVRRAVAMAIDYGTLIRKLAHGQADPAGDIVPPGGLGYTSNPYSYDPRGAAALLDRSGWMPGPDGIRRRNGVALDFDFAGVLGSGNSRNLGIVLQQNLRAVGIGVQIKTYASTVLFSPDGPLWKATYDLASYGNWLPIDPDNHFYLGCDQWTPNGMNNHFFCDPRLDAFENQGLTTNDPSARATVYSKAERLIHADVPYIPLYLRRRVYLESADLRNFQTTRTIVPWYQIWQTDTRG